MLCEVDGWQQAPLSLLSLKCRNLSQPARRNGSIRDVDQGREDVAKTQHCRNARTVAVKTGSGSRNAQKRERLKINKQQVPKTIRGRGESIFTRVVRCRTPDPELNQAGKSGIVTS